MVIKRESAIEKFKRRYENNYWDNLKNKEKSDIISLLIQRGDMNYE